MDTMKYLSVCMVKTYDSSISESLAIYFGNCFENQQCFPKEWKKAKVVPVY